MKETICAISCLILFPLLAPAQNARLGPFDAGITLAVGSAADSPPRDAAVGQLLNLNQQPSRFIRAFYPDLLRESVFDAATSAWRQARLDQQVGSTAMATGGTDLVARPGTPEFIGLAMQFGGITQSVSGSTATFRGNADAMLRSLAGEPLTCIGCMGTKGLKNLNFVATFDLSHQGTESVTPSGSAQATQTMTPTAILLPKSTRQLSSFTASYAIYNPKDTRSDQYQKEWSGWYTKHAPELQSAGNSLLETVSVFLDPVQRDKAYGDLRAEYTGKLDKATTRTEFEQLLSEYLDKVQKIAEQDVPQLVGVLANAVQAYSKYAQEYNDLVKELQGKPQVSVEYTFDRPVNQPETHNIRGVFGTNPFGGGALFSLNGAVTLYGKRPVDANYGAVRDAQFAIQFDRPLGDIVSHSAVFSLAAYGQYQFDPTVIKFTSGNLAPNTNITLPGEAQALLGKKGATGIAQAKITFKMGKNGPEVPFALTWATRKELINANNSLGAHIGLTYNLDNLFNH